MTTRSCTAEYFGQSLGRGWRSYRRTELQLTDWFVSKGTPVAVALALLWAVKLGVLVLLLYVAFWLALFALFMIAAARIASSHAADDQPETEWRNGPAGFGLYTYDGYRIDPHVADDE